MKPTITVDLSLNSLLIHWLVLEKDCPLDVIGAVANSEPMVKCPFYQDGDVLIYDQAVLVQFLQERYPGEQLLPVDPVTRAQIRQACTIVNDPSSNMIREICEVLSSRSKYMAGDKFTLLDIYIGTWLFEYVADHDISQAAYLDAYWKRISNRPAFRIASNVY